VCVKIILQINCKVGGQLWGIKIPLQKSMVVGIDVCHDTVKGTQSVAGFCASIDPHFTKYFNRVTFQRSGQEISNSLQKCFYESLECFKAINNSLPDRIIIYRDGVGDGQLDAVVHIEVPHLLEAFSKFENYNPKLAVIVVKKRIHMRFFAPFQGKLGNPLPGTVIDQGCTRQGWYDFFLISQSVRQGTVTPTHYHVVHDNTGLRPDHIQMLTFKLCHLYYNWPGTIRVPSPCMLAHKVAFLVGQSIHQTPSIKLADTYWYL